MKDNSKPQCDNAPVPVYWRVMNDLRARVTSGQWAPGSTLPGMRELAKMHQTSLFTIQRAVANLVEEGILVSADRRGVFVAQLDTAATSPVATLPVSEATAVQDIHSLPHGATLGVVLGIGTNAATVDIGKQWNWHEITLRAIENEFAASSGTIHIADHYAPPRRKSSAMAELQADGVDVLIVIGVNDDQEVRDEVVGAAMNCSVPVIYLTHEPLEDPLPHIFYDQHTAGYHAATHMLQAGFRRLLYLTPYTERWVNERYAGARQAVQRYALPGASIEYSYEPDISWQHGDDERLEQQVRQLAMRVLSDGLLTRRQNGTESQPAGIIMSSDYAAITMLTTLVEQGLQVGQDFGIMGFDDFPCAWRAGITSMRPPLNEMGRTAARLAIRLLQGEQIPSQVRQASTVIARMSTYLQSQFQTDTRLSRFSWALRKA